MAGSTVSTLSGSHGSVTTETAVTMAMITRSTRGMRSPCTRTVNRNTHTSDQPRELAVSQPNQSSEIGSGTSPMVNCTMRSALATEVAKNSTYITSLRRTHHTAKAKMPITTKAPAAMAVKSACSQLRTW